MALSDSFQSGVRIAKDWQENNRTREDRELITQMNRLKANDIIKGMEVDAEVQNLDKVLRYDAKDLDPNHPGYASQLMGIAKTRMRDLSPAAYEKARPMVAQFYDRFDARKQIEAEMDQRGTATDYTAMFGEAPAGISYQDSKFAMKAKTDFGVDPVFAEKDGIRIFDRKGTEAAVEVQREIAAETAGKLVGVAESKKLEASIPGKEMVASRERSVSQSNERIDREDKANRTVAEDNKAMARLVEDEAIFPIPIGIPKSFSQRGIIAGFVRSVPNEQFPMKFGEDGVPVPDYKSAYSMAKTQALIDMEAEARAKAGGKKEGDAPTASESERKAFGFYSSMKAAEDIMSGLPQSAQPGMKAYVLGAIPLVGNAADRATQSANQQMFKNAAEVWAGDLLRFQSGAAISKSEEEKAALKYFPNALDSEETVAQKALMRRIATQSMRVSAGRMVGASGTSGYGNAKVENGVLYAPSKEAGDAYLAANPNADVKKLKVGNQYFEVKKTP